MRFLRELHTHLPVSGFYDLEVTLLMVVPHLYSVEHPAEEDSSLLLC